MDSSSLLLHQITVSGVTVWLLQKVKSASWFPWLQHTGTSTANRVAALLTSLAAITGINYQFDPTSHTLLITHLSLATISAAAYHWLSQFVVQEGFYQVTTNK